MTNDALFYVCHKTVKARPMSRGDYNALQGWDLPANENPADEGYLVEYLDGGKPNHPDFSCYISWSPKDVFEKGYSPAPSLLTTFADRVCAEKAELDEKLAKLRAFFGTHTFAGLDDAEIDRLQRQADHMAAYSAVLDERIAAF